MACISLVTGRDDRKVDFPRQKVRRNPWNRAKNNHLQMGIHEELRPTFNRHQWDDDGSCKRCLKDREVR